jgi:hypothetical protein
VLFERRLQAGLLDGSISLAFRRWKRPQAVAGRSYRSPIGLIDVETITTVDGDISAEDARSAGCASVADLLDAIQAERGRRAGDLFAPLGWTELQDFKLHVRKLKTLGLTLSLRIGYELSPRGEAYLRSLHHPWPAGGPTLAALDTIRVRRTSSSSAAGIRLR